MINPSCTNLIELDWVHGRYGVADGLPRNGGNDGHGRGRGTHCDGDSSVINNDLCQLHDRAKKSMMG